MHIRKVLRAALCRVVPFTVSAILMISPLSLCVKAAVWEGPANVGFTYWGANGVAYFKGLDITLPSSGVNVNENVRGRTTNGMRLDLGLQEWTQPLKIYISGFYCNTHETDYRTTVIGNPWDAANYEVKYTVDGLYNGSIGIDSVVAFNSNYDSPYVGQGISIEASLEGTEGQPISGVLLRPITECGWKRTGGTEAYWGDWRYPSIRIISSESSAELEELSNVANQIIAGNEILEAMKGDIVALLQQIYINTNDMTTAAENTESLVQNILTAVDGLEGQIDDVYLLLQTSFNTLITHQEQLYTMLNSSLNTIKNYLSEILYALTEGDQQAIEETQQQVEQGTQVQEGLGELEKPDYEDLDINPSDYIDQFDGGSGESSLALSGFMGVIFGNNLISSMVMVTLSFALVAYVLYGKR